MSKELVKCHTATLPFWHKVQKLPDSYRTQLCMSWITMPHWFPRAQANVFPAVFRCHHLQQFAGGFQPRSRRDRREGACVTNPVPPLLLTFTHRRSSSWRAASAAHSPLPLLWANTLDAGAAGTAAGQWLPALSLPRRFSSEDWDSQHWDTTEECHEVSGNKYDGWFTAGNTHLYATSNNTWKKAHRDVLKWHKIVIKPHHGCQETFWCLCRMTHTQTLQNTQTWGIWNSYAVYKESFWVPNVKLDSFSQINSKMAWRVLTWTSAFP